MRSYKELTKRIPLVRTLAEQRDVDVLKVLYKNVCACIPMFYTHVSQSVMCNGSESVQSNTKKLALSQPMDYT